MENFTFGDFFAGVGGFHLAFQGLADCNFVSEWDEKAQITYKSNFGGQIAGDITKLDFGTMPNFDIMCGGFPCFATGTLVNTIHGYKKIEEINIGEKVLTHTGVFRPVLNTMQKKCNNLLNIKIMGSEWINVTEEHPFYVYNDKNFIWKEAKDLSKGDMIAININTKSENYQWNGTQNNINQYKNTEVNTLPVNTEKFWWLVGRYVGDGWRINYKRKNRKNSFMSKVIICCGLHENIDKEIIDIGLHATKSKERTGYKYHISNKEFNEFLIPFGKYAHNKKIPVGVLNLPLNLLQSFFNGYLSADGYCTKNKSTNIIQISTTSSKLAYGFQQIIHKLYGVSASMVTTKAGKKYIEGRLCKVKKCYILKAHINTDKNHTKIVNNYILVPFRKKEKITFNDYVYNLEVETDNSYCINNIIVHNCQPFSIAGEQKGFQDTRGTVFFDIVKIIKEKKPKVIFLENVKNLVSHDQGNTFKIICQSLENEGYFLKFQVLNGKTHGNVPQNRERIFIVGFLNKNHYSKFEFPEPIPLTKTIEDCLEKNVDQKYYQMNINSPSIQKMIAGMINKNVIYQYRRYYMRENKEKVCPTLTANMASGGHNVPLLLDDIGIRKLTPRECFNFQGFPSDFILPNVADSHLYKQAGNSVVVPLVRRIAEKIIEAIN